MVPVIKTCDICIKRDQTIRWNGSFYCRKCFKSEIKRFGIKLFVELLKVNNEVIRSDATCALQRWQDIRTLHPLIALLDEEDADVRRKAVSILGEIRSFRTIKPLIALITDKNACVREEVARALSKKKNVRTVEPLLALLKDDIADVRNEATWALGKKKDLRAVEPLIVLLKDKNNSYQSKTAEILGEMRDVRAIEPLISVLNDKHTFYPSYVTVALKVITGLKIPNMTPIEEKKWWNDWWKMNQNKYAKHERKFNTYRLFSFISKKENLITQDSITKPENLSNQEIKFLIEKGEFHIESRNFQQALKYYNQIVDAAVPHPHYFKRRAWINRMNGTFDAAINDMNKAIELDPDDSNSYWERGACHAHKLSQIKKINNIDKKTLLEIILKDYKSSVERNPTSPEAWLAILETDMLLHKWDDAISDYGSCKSYIDSREYQLIRAWLGCLSLIFAEDNLEEEDTKLLYDKTIRLKMSHWCISEIDSLLIELAQEGFSKERLTKATEFHDRFLSHFDEPPLRIN